MPFYLLIVGDNLWTIIHMYSDRRWEHRLLGWGMPCYRLIVVAQLNGQRTWSIENARLVKAVTTAMSLAVAAMHCATEGHFAVEGAEGVESSSAALAHVNASDLLDLDAKEDYGWVPGPCKMTHHRSGLSTIALILCEMIHQWVGDVD